jgi:hypothetical protein
MTYVLPNLSTVSAASMVAPARDHIRNQDCLMADSILTD